jgi:RNA polymerase sigma factor (sigma-70 family)
MTRTQGNVVLRHIRGLAAAESVSRLPDRQLLDRFVRSREDSAFAALVRRHGPLVLGVCRRVLHNPDDAEDAFQATFLALARKAASAGRRASLGTWLYQVAFHTALRARKQSATRRQREDKAPPRPQPDPLAEVTGRELLTALDEELHRLPERLRAPLVLCYLEGRARDEAARELGWSLGTLKRRLEQGRASLHVRLSRRGISLAALLAGGAAGVAVSSARATATTRAALLAAGARVSLSRPLLAVVAAGLLAIAGGLMAYRAAGATAGAEDKQPTPQLAPPKDAAPARAAAEEPKEQLFSGRVLDPDGKPVAGAKVYLLQWAPPGGRPPDGAPKVWAETDKDGGYSFTAPRYQGVLFVTAPGFGPGWDTTGPLAGAVRVGESEPATDKQVVRLARDDVPVSGRLLDVQGEPVAGATVRVFSLSASADGSLNKWMEAIKKRTLGESLREDQYLSSFTVDGLAHFFPPVTSDKDGRFQIKGVGRERVVAFTVEGAAIETRVLHVVTRPGVGPSDLRIPENMMFFGGGTIKELRLKPYYPPTFTHTADPGRVVTGVVRDKASGSPVAGAVVRSEQPVRYPAYYNRATADKDGRYRLTGMPLSQPGPFSPLVGPGNGVVALPPDGEPYLAMSRRLPAGKEAVATFDFDLPRGAWLEGQVKDKATGRGVAASVSYFLFDSPLPGTAEASLLRDAFARPVVMTDPEGKFRMLVAQEEHGLLGASALGENAGRYRTGVGADKVERGIKDTAGAVTFPIPTGPQGNLSADEFDALADIKPEKGASRVRCDLELDPGRTVTVQVRGPDGKPLAGAQAFGQSARVSPLAGWSQRALPAEFPVYGLAPGKARTVLVVHPEKNLAARCEIKGDEKGPVVIDLQPAATVVGRLVHDDGRPRKDTAVDVRFRLGADWILHVGRYKTDAEGKFRVEGLIPGLSYQGTFVPRPDQPYAHGVFYDLTLKGGEVKDVGDVKARKADE